jgi:hypothetical protein
LPGHRIYPVIAAVIGYFLLSPDAAAQERVRRVGVVVSLTVNMTPAEGRDLATMLGAALEESLPIEVIAGQETERRLPQGGLPENCVAEATCRLDLGRRLDADEILLLVIVRLGDQIQIDATWSNVSSGGVASRPATTLAPGQEPTRIFIKAAPALLPHIARRRSEPAGTSIIVVSPAGQPDSGRHVTPGTWVAAGVSATALLGGTVFGLSAMRKYDSLYGRGCATELCPRDDINQLRAHALTADLLLGTALASGVVAAILYWKSAPGAAADTGATRPPVNIHMGAESVGISLGGAF